MKTWVTSETVANTKRRRGSTHLVMSLQSLWKRGLTLLIVALNQEEAWLLQKERSALPTSHMKNKTSTNQSWQNWHLLVLYHLTVAVVKGLKSLAAFIVSAEVAKSRFVLVGWWLPSCPPSLEVGSPTRGLPGQGLFSILAILGGGTGCSGNEAA